MTSRPEAADAFFAPFGLGARELVSLVGGGGKTTLLKALGDHLSRRGTVLLTTTTKMAVPPASRTPAPLLMEDGAALKDGAERIRARFRQGAETGTAAPRLTAAARSHVQESGWEKLEGFAPDTVGRLWDDGAADFVICEADGARQKPLKAWADWEPPVPARTTLLCAVLSAARLDEPLDEEHVHRMALMTERFGFHPGDVLTPERLAVLLESPHGYLKNAPPTGRRAILLNQTDRLSPERLDALMKPLSDRHGSNLAGRLLMMKPLSDRHGSNLAGRLLMMKPLSDRHAPSLAGRPLTTEGGPSGHGFLTRLARALRSWDLLVLGSLHALRLEAVLPLARSS